MAKKKKTLITFLLLITALYSVWDAIKGISLESGVPISILIIAILVLYVLWEDEDS